MSQAAAALVEGLVADHPADAARVLERFPLTDGAAFVGELSPDRAAPVLASMTAGAAAAVVSLLEPEVAAALLGRLPADVAVATVRPLAPEARARVLERLDEDGRQRLAGLLEPGGAAGALADPRVLSLSGDTTIAEALDAVRGSDGAAPDYAYVVESPATFLGQLAVAELTRADPGSRLRDLLPASVTAIPAEADERRILSHPGWQSLHELPVVDRAGRLVGAISFEVPLRLRQAQRGEQQAVTGAVAFGELYWRGLIRVFDELGNAAARPRDVSGGRTP